jgi:peptide/nickel transport system substrate-binding protein
VLRRCAISALLVAAALPAPARTRPHYGGTLHVEIEGDPWQGEDGLARSLVLDGLTTLDANGAVRPALAANWQTTDNDHRWEFRLRPGVHFHDGTLLTAQAAVMSLNLASAAHCPWTAVRAVGSSVIFTSDTPLPNLPAILAGDSFLIALTRGAGGQTPAQPTGTGPFRVAAMAGNSVTLTANENGWQGRPFLDQIVLTSHRAIRDQWLDLSVGRADVVQIPPEQLRQAQVQRLTVVASPPVVLLALDVSDAGGLANPMMRAAIAYAIDRGALYNVIFQRQGEVTGSLLPQALTGYAFLFASDRDLNRSNELRGGFNPPALTVTAGGDGVMQLTAQRLALNLRDAGFNVQIAANGQYPDLKLIRLPIAGSDPAGVLATVQYEAGQTPIVVGREKEEMFRAEHDILDLHTIIPLLDLPRSYGIGNRVHNLGLRADGTPDLALVSVEDSP